jgi:hypothetical protein
MLRNVFLDKCTIANSPTTLGTTTLSIKALSVTEQNIMTMLNTKHNDTQYIYLKTLNIMRLT